MLFQFAGLDPKAGGPLSVSTPPGAIPLDRWIDLVYAPPANGKAVRAEIKIDGERLAARPVTRLMGVSTAVVGIGCEFGTPLKGPCGKRRPNFPGLIRQMNIGELEPRPASVQLCAEVESVNPMVADTKWRCRFSSAARSIRMDIVW